MSSAEATLQIKTKVGQSSPTMLQTLLILLKLYDSDDTDKAAWVREIESHPNLLIPFLISKPPPLLSNWESLWTLEDIRILVLALANQVTLAKLPRDIRDNEREAAIAGRLMQQLAPEHERRAMLASRLLGTSYQSNEPEIAESLTYFNRSPALLHDTSLLTRVIAVAHHCANTESPLYHDCADLTAADPTLLKDICREAAALPVPAEDVASLFVDQLAVVNLKLSVSRLTMTTDSETALRELTSAMFDTAALNLYLQKDGGWSNGTIQLTGPHSLIATAAATGNPASSTSHTMTVVDEQSISNLGTTDALAIPVLMDSHADSCAAVLLVGLTKSRLMEIAGSSDLIDRYQSIARSIFTVQKEPSISIERLDSFAREIIHEANNPISTVQNYLKVLSLKLDPEHEAQETLEIISEELFRAADIIRSFREIQPDESDTQNSCQVNKVVRDITSLFEKANERLEFSCALDSENPVGAVSTESLKQCITNLIKNATEALQPGGTITVTTTAGFRQAGQTYLEITVADNGPGIDTTLEDIFARGATTKAGEHAGQGLAVVQNLCTQANGFISYRTGDNGTEFRMTIPQINTSTQS